MSYSAGHQDNLDPVTGAYSRDEQIDSAHTRDTKSRLLRFARSIGGDDSLAWRFLLVLLAVYVVKQALMVVIFPAFSGHDEVAHYAYVQTVVTEQRVPELIEDQIPDYFYRYCQFILDWSPCDPEDPRWLDRPFRFADWGSAGVHPAGEQYAANHPPLYYLMAAPVYWLSETASPETQQYLLRLLAIPFGMAVVLLAFLTSQTVFPGDRFLAITVPAFVAFQPQVSYEAAMVNNDIVAIAAMALIIFLMVRGIRHRFPIFDCVLLGLALGTALLVKSNALAVTPIIAFAMVGSIGPRRIRSWIGHGAIVAGLGAVICAPWYLYLWRTYGNLDGLDQVESMQEPWNNPAGTFFGMLTDRNFYWGRWSESWGQFGWRRIPLSDWLLWLIAIPILIAVVGLVLYSVRSIRARRTGPSTASWWGRELPDRVQVLSIVTLLISVVVAYLAIIQFGTRFGLTQARYFFPVINAIAILLALGLRTLVPFRFRPAVQGLVVSSLVLLNLIIYTKYVVPYWHLTEW
jgi:4-amino-4-deoxy-L-arabinose transferase-like glycosyltransferase